MNRRPPTITALSILYMLVGLVSTSYHLTDFKTLATTVPQALETLLIILLGVGAIAAGYYMLQGKNWARWLAFGWTLFHVIVSAFQSLGGLVFHSVFVFLLGLLLFSKESNQWFRLKPATEPMVPWPVTETQMPPKVEEPRAPPPVDPQS